MVFLFFCLLSFHFSGCTFLSLQLATFFFTQSPICRRKNDRCRSHRPAVLLSISSDLCYISIKLRVRLSLFTFKRNHYHLPHTWTCETSRCALVFRRMLYSSVSTVRSARRRYVTGARFTLFLLLPSSKACETSPGCFLNKDPLGVLTLTYQNIHNIS